MDWFWGVDRWKDVTIPRLVIVSGIFSAAPSRPSLERCGYIRMATHRHSSLFEG